MREIYFALGLYDHRHWGQLLIPLSIRVKSGEKFYTPGHTVFSHPEDKTFLKLSHTEKEIVKIIDEYSDQNLFSFFSKDKNPKEFLTKVKPESIENFIRPYINKRLHKIFEILRRSNIEVFLRDKSRANVFEDDFLDVLASDTKPVFSFKKGQENSMYSLKLVSEGKNVRIKDQFIDIICNSPAIIRINNQIHFIPDIEAKKLKPFFIKDNIEIDQKFEKQYFKVFLKNLVLHHEVKAEGFAIELVKPEKKALLCIEKGLRNNAVILLRFSYGDRKILANAEQKVFVDFYSDKEGFRYEKFYRDEEFESEYHDLLTNLGLISFDQANYEVKNVRELSYQEQLCYLIEWINKNSKELFETGLELVQPDDKLYFTGTVGLIISSSLDVDWFDIKAKILVGDIEIPFYNFRKHILEGQREYKLDDGSIFIIPNEWFTRFQDLFTFATSKDGKIRLHKQHFSILERAEQGVKSLDFHKLELLNRKENLSPAILPEKLAATLRPYQIEGYTWLSYLQHNGLGGCLADDMGLGKTLQAISMLIRSKEAEALTVKVEKKEALQPDLFSAQESVLSSLIVVPASLVHNWQNEIRRFAPTLKSLAYIGSQRSELLKNFHSHDVIISSYHTIRQDIETISNFHFHYVILDESQVIKNPSSKIYKAMQILNSDHRLVLTGTPIENSLIDLWSQMNFINKGLLGSLNFFKREYVIPIEKKKSEISSKKLKKLINPFILRRTKEEVAKDLPDISDQVIYCNMTDEQKKFYDEEKSGIRNAIFEQIEKEGVEKSSIIVLQGLTRLRQISNHPKMVDENYLESSGKFEEIIRNTEDVISRGHKVLIFSSFVKHLNLLKENLETEGIEHTMLTGETTNREDIVKAFQENENCKVFLISLKAGGVGLNLTAADYVFILDPWWNPASEEQAISRAHRIGQVNNVFVYRFISANSIEEKILKLQEKKSQLADSFIHSNNPMKDISKEELEGLFE
ncbi:MAG: DEAD/DEAH box helicase [Bacteroidales bacterium]|nr:DEAD/DEAH box helicase [Bacteroidales bacterium]MCF8404090.1 DEAD/DEAH box helicase [Bacteroidales bacterium]